MNHWACNRNNLKVYLKIRVKLLEKKLLNGVLARCFRDSKQAVKIIHVVVPSELVGPEPKRKQKIEFGFFCLSLDLVHQFDEGTNYVHL
jgi:hypothetical protein